MWFFRSFFFLSVLKVTNNFVLHINGSCDVHGLRTTTVRDVTMMYCKERYMENVPFHLCRNQLRSHLKNGKGQSTNHPIFYLLSYCMFYLVNYTVIIIE